MSCNEGCACSSWASQNSSVSSPTVSYMGVGGLKIYYCGEVVVAKTIKNYGKQFLGCLNYKRSGGNEESKGCNYLEWFNEDNGDERDATIGK
ncbi:hypothetical protein DEO72_LG5g1565 [Vigna unguiculata]|uniref:Zinc finger GRF-type domain-containing protein n=1 Tax=Vigna unguiculata TaxID=3917 RepID=A0A4D6LY91_VIGUN|nr:hypothetical protein DEO72_LG5g1565 [Vigna unguiculata]